MRITPNPNRPDDYVEASEEGLLLVLNGSHVRFDNEEQARVFLSAVQLGLASIRTLKRQAARPIEPERESGPEPE